LHPGFAVLAVLLCPLACLAGSPADLFQGTFSEDDQVELFSFTSNGSTPITIESYGYAGGVFGSTTIAAGGFAPDATVFDASGDQEVTDSGGHCPPTGTDSVTGNCDDPYIQQVFSAGTYTLALTVYDNLPVDALSDGFRQTGNPGFTCAEGGMTGEFCDVTDALYRQRTGNYAISIAGATAASDITSATPEPATLPLMLCGALMVTTLYRRRRAAN
jgi:hypothetical protein